MKRIKSIDIIRGIAILCMFLYHIQIWWINEAELPFIHALYSIYAILGTTGFLFISGVSTSISHRNRLQKIDEEFTEREIKREYFIRAFFILIIALLFNLFVAFTFGEITDIWKWFILLTIAFSLFLAWPLLKVSKLLRILVATLFFITDQFLVRFLANFEGQFNFFGIINYIVYNTLDQDPVMSFFCFFIIGTVIGDLIFETYQKKDDLSKKHHVKNKILIPCLIIGSIMILIGMLVQFPEFLKVEKAGFESSINFPNFLSRGTISWMMFAIGIELVLISTLFSIEEYEIIKTKKSYRFLFYFSYYSFTTYISHNLLYFAFPALLNIYNVFFITIFTVIIFGLMLNILYKKLGPHVSLKANIGRLSSYLSKKKIKY